MVGRQRSFLPLFRVFAVAISTAPGFIPVDCFSFTNPMAQTNVHQHLAAQKANVNEHLAVQKAEAFCRARRLLVLDFDYTVIDENSDTFVIEQLSLHKSEAMARLDNASRQNRWTAGMDAEMAALFNEGTTIAQIEACIGRIRVDPELVNVLHSLSGSTDIRILSDANSWFIDVILKANGLDSCFSKIVSNPASLHSGRVFVAPYHTDPHHRRSTSPPNLCKGRVMDEWLAEKPWQQVCYCGDGGGDLEGALRVPSGGSIAVRNGWSLHTKLLRLKQKGQAPAAEMVLWETQQQLAQTLASLA